MSARSLFARPWVLRADVPRVIASVTACRGMPDPVAEVRAMRDLIRRLALALANTDDGRDETHALIAEAIDRHGAEWEG